jgi:hypothetical protein
MEDEDSMLKAARPQMHGDKLGPSHAGLWSNETSVLYEMVPCLEDPNIALTAGRTGKWEKTDSMLKAVQMHRDRVGS